MEAMILRPQFERLWNDSSEEEKNVVREYIEKCDKKGLSNWLRTHRSLDLGERSYEYLREAARRLGIRNYSRLTKPELIRLIKEAE